MSSPRLAPWLMPETISSGVCSTSPSAAKRTQSTGVPSVAKPIVPSPNSTSSTHSGERVVMLRAVALRFESGAITDSSTPGHLQQRAAQHVQAGGADAVVVGEQDLHRGPQDSRASVRAPIPDTAHGRRPSRRPRARGRPASRRSSQATSCWPLPTHQHRADERAHHVAHEGVRLDPEGEHVGGLLDPLGAHDLALEAHVVGLGGREGGEVVPAERAPPRRRRARRGRAAAPQRSARPRSKTLRWRRVRMR